MTDFEKDIRDKFADHELYIDTEDIWPGIEEKLNKGAGRKRFLWWWFLPLLLLLIPLAYHMMSDKDDEHSDIVKKSQSEDIGNYIAHENHESVDAGVLELYTDNETEYIHETTRAKTNDAAIEKDSEVTGIAKIDRKSDARTLIPDAAQAENFDNETAEKQVKTSDIKSISIESDTDSPNIPVIKKEAFTTGDEVKLAKINTIELLKTRINKLENEAFILKVDNPSLPDEIAGENNVSRTISSWNRSLDLALGYAFASKYLKPKDINFVPYKELRKQTESHLEAITGAVTYQFTHKSGFFINTGLHYCQIDERFSNADSIYLLKYGEGLISTTIKPDGSIVEDRGSKMIVEQRIWDKSIYNYYFFFDVPINIGYSGAISQIGYEISGGISYNISFLKRGQIMGINSYPVEINEESGIFRKAGGLSLNSGLKLFLPFRRQLYFIEPNIRYNLSSITTTDYPLHQNYLSYGINIGARIKF